MKCEHCAEGKQFCDKRLRMISGVMPCNVEEFMARCLVSF